MSNFDRSLPIILKFEGGLADDPQDPGGRTAYGITQRTYNGWRVGRGLAPRDVWTIEASEYRDIYLNRFWVRGHCDALPWPLALIHFDACVNVGTEGRDAQGNRRTSAITLLQRALGVEDDGAWGALTAAAAGAATRETCKDYLLVRMIYYISLDDRHPERLKFFNSWLGRLAFLYPIARSS